MSDQRRCDGCAFYWPVSSSKGKCRRNAPVLVGGGSLATEFPEVWPDWWCGEHWDPNARVGAVTWSGPPPASAKED